MEDIWVESRGKRSGVKSMKRSPRVGVFEGDRTALLGWDVLEEQANFLPADRKNNRPVRGPEASNFPTAVIDSSSGFSSS